MNRKRQGGKGQGALELIEQAVHLLRLAPGQTLSSYYLGSVPFVLGFLYFWTDMSRGVAADDRCTPAALATALLFLWMKTWQAIFARQLRSRIIGEPGPGLTLRVWFRTAISQTALQPSKLFVLPLSLLIALPLGWVYAFYANVTAFGTEEGGIRRLMAKALRQAQLWPKQNHLLLAVVGLFGLVVFLNVAISMAQVPFLLKTFLGIETAFTRGGWSFLNTTFLACAFGLVYLCLDPILKAAYVLRCFYGESLQTGEDLKADLKQFAPSTRAAAIALMLALAVPLSMNWREKSAGPHDGGRFLALNLDPASARPATTVNTYLGGEVQGEGATGRATSHLDCTAEAASFQRRRDALLLSRGKERSSSPQASSVQSAETGPWMFSALQWSKLFASCDEIFGVRPSRPQQATHGWTPGIAPTAPGSQCFCPQGRAHPGCLRLRRAVFAAVAAAAEPTPPAARAAQSGVSPVELDRSIEQVIRQREYSWRLPREKRIAEEGDRKGFFAAFMDGLVDTLRGWGRALKRWVRAGAQWVAEVINWIVEKVFSRGRLGSGGARSGSGWMTSLQALVFVLLVLVACTVVLFCWRLWRQRRRPVEAVSRAVASVPDLTDENLVASQLPEEDWLNLAQELMGKGELRLALRALYLGGLAHLARRELIRIAKFKSNRDYEQELRRRTRGTPELQAAFAESVATFDRAWYGLHEVSEEALRHFQKNLEKIRGC